MRAGQRTSKHASLETPPRATSVYLVRYLLPERTSQTACYLTEGGALRRMTKLRASGARCVLHVADVGPWSATN